MQPRESELHLGMAIGQLLDRTRTAIDIGVEGLHMLQRIERRLVAMTNAPTVPPETNAWRVVGSAVWQAITTREGIILAFLAIAGLLGIISPTEIKTIIVGSLLSLS